MAYNFIGLVVASTAFVLASAFAQSSVPDSPTIEIISLEPIFQGAYQPERVRLARDGKLAYVLSRQDHSVAVFDVTTGELRRRIGRMGSQPGDLYNPSDIAVSKAGEVWIADRGNRRVQKFLASGEYSMHFPLDSPISIDVLPSGDLVVVDSRDKLLMRLYSPKGQLLTMLGTPLDLGTGDEVRDAFLSRGRATVDGENIWYMFRSLPKPEVRIFSAGGSVKQTFWPDGTELGASSERAKKELAKSVTNSTRFAYSGTLNALAIDPVTRNVWIAVAGPIAYVYRSDLQKIGEYRFKGRDPFYYGASDIQFDTQGRGYIVVPGKGCFRFTHKFH